MVNPVLPQTFHCTPVARTGCPTSHLIPPTLEIPMFATTPQADLLLRLTTVVASMTQNKPHLTLGPPLARMPFISRRPPLPAARPQLLLLLAIIDCMTPILPHLRLYNPAGQPQTPLTRRLPTNPLSLLIPRIDFMARVLPHLRPYNPASQPQPLLTRGLPTNALPLLIPPIDLMTRVLPHLQPYNPASQP